MKKLLKNAKNKAHMAYIALGATLVSSASYAVDTAAVSTAIEAAEADALATGEFVITTVASLVVVGLIITMVRKL